MFDSRVGVLELGTVRGSWIAWCRERGPGWSLILDASSLIIIINGKMQQPWPVKGLVTKSLWINVWVTLLSKLPTGPKYWRKTPETPDIHNGFGFRTAMGTSACLANPPMWGLLRRRDQPPAWRPFFPTGLKGCVTWVVHAIHCAYQTTLVPGTQIPVSMHFPVLVMVTSLLRYKQRVPWFSRAVYVSPSLLQRTFEQTWNCGWTNTIVYLFTSKDLKPMGKWALILETRHIL